MRGAGSRPEDAREPQRVCLLRLSAIGDVCHALAVLRNLQGRWPGARFTWIVGAVEAELLRGLEGVELVVFEKGRGALRRLRRALAGRRFDVLLHMQNSMRGNLASLCVRAPVRVGFDRRLTKDFQWVFTNRRAPYRERAHVLEGLMTFAQWAGVERPVPRWDLPVPEEARASVARLVPDREPLLVISPCANPRLRNWRNWTPEGYAAVADHARERHGMQVALSGGASAEEREMGAAIAARARPGLLDLIGRTSLKELLALLQRAQLVIAPDSGPAHLAAALGTTVIGLYATTDPARAAPYTCREWVVSRYAEAAEAEFGVPAERVPFGRRVRRPDAMARILPADVTAMVDRWSERRAAPRGSALETT